MDGDRARHRRARNTSCLVGTPDQIAAAVLEYYRLGIHSFLLRGFENPHDTMAIGRELIPRIKDGAEQSTSRPKRPSRLLTNSKHRKMPSKTKQENA